MTVKVLREKKTIEALLGVECSLEDLLNSLEISSFELKIKEGGIYYGCVIDDKLDFFIKEGKKIKAVNITVKIYPSGGQVAESFSNIE